MGQGLACFNCIYGNSCHHNDGLSINLCCVGCWCCIPEALGVFRGHDCVRCGACDNGIGYTFFCCHSMMLFTPDWLRDFSIRQSIGDIRGQLYDVNIVPAQPSPYLGGGPRY